MADDKPRSNTRKSVLLYPETKDKFDRVHRGMGLENHSKTMDRVLDFYVRKNEMVKV